MHIGMMDRDFNVCSNKNRVDSQEVLEHLRTLKFCLCVSV